MTLPIVAVLSMGGTISCEPSQAGGLIPASDPTVNLALKEVEVRSFPWSLTDSTEITFDELDRLAVEIRRIVDSGVDAVVVTQGTDTLDETAYAMSLLRPIDRPVVFTAAMRAPATPSSDADSNLIAAIRTAIAPELACATTGAVVVMNGQIHSARWVQKTHTQHLEAFSSGEVGLLGLLDEAHPVFLRTDPEPVISRLLTADTRKNARVGLLTAMIDDDARLIRTIGGLGYQGLVIEGAGGGHVSGAVAEELGVLAQEMPVVFASRTRGGPVLTSTYGSAGAELDLLRRGCIPSGMLPALKARVLLTLLLRSGYGREEGEELFRAEGQLAVTVGRP